jgi:hypothetical protein
MKRVKEQSSRTARFLAGSFLVVNSKDLSNLRSCLSICQSITARSEPNRQCLYSTNHKFILTRGEAQRTQTRLSAFFLLTTEALIFRMKTMTSSEQSRNEPASSERRLSIDSCDLYADVERGRHRQVLKRDISSRRKTPSTRFDSPSPNSGTASATKPSKYEYEVASEAASDTNQMRIQHLACENRSTSNVSKTPPRSDNDFPRKSTANNGSPSAAKPSGYEYEVAPEAASDTNQMRVLPGRENRSASNIVSKTPPSGSDCSSHREGTGDITTLANKSLSRSTTTSKSPKTSNSEERSKSRERLARDNSGRSQVSNSGRSSNSRPSSSRSPSRQRSSDWTHESNRSLLSSSESRRLRDSYQSSQRGSAKSASPNPSRQREGRRLRDSHQSSQRSSAKSASPNPSQREPRVQSGPHRVVERHHRSTSSRKPAEMTWSPELGYVSKSSPTIGSSEKHASYDNRKSDKKKKKDRKDTNKEKPALTTRSWKAQLALRFGRKPQTPNIPKSQSYRVCDRIPSTLLCAGDFEGAIQDDLTAIP